MDPTGSRNHHRHAPEITVLCHQVVLCHQAVLSHQAVLCHQEVLCRREVLCHQAVLARLELVAPLMVTLVITVLGAEMVHEVLLDLEGMVTKTTIPCRHQKSTRVDLTMEATTTMMRMTTTMVVLNNPSVLNAHLRKHETLTMAT